MSLLSDIFLYWANNSTLTAALPLAKVWTGLVPNKTQFPYAAVIPVSSEPQFTTGRGYIEGMLFQISVFDTNLDTVEALAQVVMGQFDYRAVGGARNISCEREGYLVVADDETPKIVYHAVITYRFYENRSLS